MSKIPDALQHKPDHSETVRNEEPPLARSFAEVLRRAEQAHEEPKTPPENLFISNKEKKNLPEMDSAPEVCPPTLPPFSAFFQADITDLSLVTNVQEATIALLQKLTEKITEVTQRGVTTTTVHLGGNAGSFSGTQIKIDQYDTAPHSFNIELQTDPNSAEVMGKHLLHLQSALENHFPHCVFSRLFVSIKQESPPLRPVSSPEKKRKEKGSPMKTKKI